MTNAAVGVPGIVRPEHLRPGAVAIGGGVRYAGRRLLPDLDETCAEVAGAITPRVGGVGPTTVAMLFRNAVQLAERLTAVEPAGRLTDGSASGPSAGTGLTGRPTADTGDVPGRSR